MKIKFMRIHENAVIPIKAHKDDACYDLFSIEDANVSPQETKLFRLGFKVAIPRGWELQIRPRSGLALKRRLTVLNSPGTIDSIYRGEIGVILHNVGMVHVFIPVGTKIAQMSLKRVNEIEFVEVESEELLGETVRGEDGFGSTG